MDADGDEKEEDGSMRRGALTAREKGEEETMRGTSRSILLFELFDKYSCDKESGKWNICERGEMSE